MYICIYLYVYTCIHVYMYICIDVYIWATAALRPLGAPPCQTSACVASRHAQILIPPGVMAPAPPRGRPWGPTTATPPPPPPSQEQSKRARGKKRARGWPPEDSHSNDPKETSCRGIRGAFSSRIRRRNSSHQAYSPRPQQWQWRADSCRHQGPERPAAGQAAAEAAADKRWERTALRRP